MQKTFQKSKTVAWIQKEQYKISATDEIRIFSWLMNMIFFKLENFCSESLIS